MSATRADTGIDQIADALRSIPADDRDTWVRIAMAIKSQLGDSGFSIWDDWSQTGQTYSELDAQAVWRSIKSGPVQIGTLFHLAKEHGYRPDRQAPARPTPQKKAPLPPKRDTGAYAAEIWLRADTHDGVVTAHAYARHKGITSAGGAGRTTASGRVIGRNADCLVVPIRDVSQRRVVGVQCINEQGAKQTFGAVAGNCLLLGNMLDLNLHWFIAEGWASSYSMVFHHYGGNACCAVAFGKGNLDTVALRLADEFVPREIIILREQDT